MKNFYLYLSLLFIGCLTPGSKTEYLAQYQNFIIGVKNEWKFYNEDNWNEKSKEFKKYSEKYYKEFVGELTPSEIIKVYRFDFAFHFYKGDISVTNLLSSKYNEVLKKYWNVFLKEIEKIGYEVFILLKDIRSAGFVNIVNRLIQ